jgi:hypothetical protein
VDGFGQLTARQGQQRSLRKIRQDLSWALARSRSGAVRAAIAGQWTGLLAGHGHNDWYGEGC